LSVLATVIDVDCAVCGSRDREAARVRVPREELAFTLGSPDGRSRWVVCRNCGLVYQSPRADGAADHLYLDGAYHVDRGGVPEHYVAYSLRRSRAALTWALSELTATDPSTPSAGRALDIGCGLGGALVFLREEGWDVAGVEPDPVLSEIARARFGLPVITSLFDSTTFATERFDLAYSCHVWEHLDDPVATSRAAHQVLRPNAGHLVIVVPTFRRARTLAWSCFAAAHTYMFTHVSLGNVLRQAGFEPIAHRYAGAADSELWLIARAVTSPTPDMVREPARAIQRELMLVPLRAPLGLFRRTVTHTRTLVANPRDFAQRFIRHGRWRARRALQVVRGLRVRRQGSHT
jgi:SAM-dependent methyltransferase